MASPRPLACLRPPVVLCAQIGSNRVSTSFGRRVHGHGFPKRAPPARPRSIPPARASQRSSRDGQTGQVSAGRGCIFSGSCNVRKYFNCLLFRVSDVSRLVERHFRFLECFNRRVLSHLRTAWW